MLFKKLPAALFFLAFVSCKGGGGGSSTDGGTVQMISISDSTAFVSYSYTPFLSSYGTNSGLPAITGNEIIATGSGSNLTNSGALSSTGTGLQSAADNRKTAIDLDEDRILNVDVSAPTGYDSCSILGNDFSGVLCNVLGFSINLGNLLSSAGHSLSLQISALKNGSEEKQSNSILLSHFQFEPVVNLNPADTGEDDSVSELIIYNDDLYFNGTESSSDRHLYRWNGNILERFSDMEQNGNDVTRDLVLYDSKLFFRGSINNSDQSLLFTDGTSIERLVDTSTVSTQSDEVRTLMVRGNNLYFHASTDGTSNSRNLYRYDGAQIIKISSGLGNIPFEFLQEYQGKTYLSNINHDVFHEWDGSSIRGAFDTRSGGQDFPREQLLLGNDLIIRGALSNTIDNKLFKYDGNTVELVSNINGSGNFEVTNVLNEVFENKVFYISNDNTNNSLMSYDGTEIVEHYRTTDGLRLLNSSEGHIFFTQDNFNSGNNYTDLFSYSPNEDRILKWVEGSKALTNSEFSNLGSIFSISYLDPIFYKGDLYFGLIVSGNITSYSKGLHRLRKLPFD